MTVKVKVNEQEVEIGDITTAETVLAQVGLPAEKYSLIRIIDVNGRPEVVHLFGRVAVAEGTEFSTAARPS